MAQEKIENLFKTLDGSGVRPSGAVWASIHRKLGWMNFSHFSVFTFNIYYTGVIVLLLGAGSLYFANTRQDQILNSENSEITRSEMSQSTQNPAQEKTKEFVQSRTHDQIRDYQEEQTLPAEYQEDIQSRSTGLKHADSDISIKGNEKQRLAQSSNEIPDSEIQSHKTSSNEPEGELVIDQISKTQLLSQTNKQTELSDSNNKMITSVIPENDSKKQNEENQVNENFEITEVEQAIVYDTVKVYDTIPVFDTINIPQKTKKDFSGQKHWSFDVYSGLNTGNCSYSSSDVDFENTLNSASSLRPGVNFGLSMNYNLRNWMFQTGFEYRQLNENFSFVSYNSENLNEFWNYTPAGTLHYIDTLEWEFVYNPEDSAFILIPVIQDSVVQLYDSSLIKIPETEYKNHYSYIQIPLHLSYPLFADNNFALRAKLGASVGIWLNSKGKTLAFGSPYSLEAIDAKQRPFARVTLNWIVGFSMEYRVGEHYKFIVDPYYRRNTGSIYESDPMFGVSISDIGVNLGLRYEF